MAPQVLTENGESIDFGSIAEDCLAEQQLVLVNCGRSEVTRSVLETRFTLQPFTSSKICLLSLNLYRFPCT